jgi:hypothetical protein
MGSGDGPSPDLLRHRGDRRPGFEIVLVAIAVFGLVARVAYVLTIGRRLTIGSDAIWYALQAGPIATGKGYIDPAAFYQLGKQIPTANFPPLWPMALAVANRAGIHTQTGYQLVGAILGSITVALTGLLGRRVAGPRTGLVAALIVACCPLLIAADGSLMSESLYVLLVTGALLASYRALDRPNLIRFGLVGMLIGFATLTRSDALFLAPILGAAVAWRVRSTPVGRRIALGACVLGVVLAIQVPWVVRSSVQLGGAVVMSSNSGSMLEGANCPSTYSGQLIGAWDYACTNRTRSPGTSELEWSAASRNAGIDYARNHLTRLPQVVWARVLRVWGLWAPVEQARLESVESRNLTWQLLGWAYDMVALVAAVPGTVLLVRRRAILAPLGAVVAAVVVTAAFSYGNQRFRLAAEPAVAVAAATTVAAFWRASADRWRTSRLFRNG